MKCKNCGAEMHEGDTFCGECGIKIESQEKQAVKCSECGKFFNKDFGICPFCGTELAEDNIEIIDNKDTLLSVTDTEEAFVEENTEGNFVLCPNCNNTYDINVGLCAICGYSATELGGTPNKQEEDDSICPDCGEQIDKEFGLCFSCGYSVKKSKVNRETNEKSCEDVVNCSRHNKCFSANGGNCPFCSYTPEKAILYEKNKETFIGKCDICDRESVSLRKHEINDWMGTRYRNMCENCITKYENKQEQPKNNESSENSSFFSQHKKGIKIAVIVAIVLFVIIMIIYANSGYICSQCGDRFYEGKTVFGEYWCNDCFYDY